MNGNDGTIVDYLTSVPAWYLATCEGDQPHVRPFSFAAVQDDQHLVLHGHDEGCIPRACDQSEV